MTYTVLFALWAIAEALHVQRALRAGAALRFDLRAWGAARVAWMVTRPLVGTLVLLYAFTLFAALLFFSIPVLNQVLAGLFGVVHALDPSFPYDGAFRLPESGSMGARYSGGEWDAAGQHFRAVALGIFGLFASALAVLDRWADLLWYEDQPIPLQGRLVRNGICATAAGAALFLGIYAGAAAGPEMRVGFPLALGVVAALVLGGLGSVILVTAHAITRVFRARVRTDEAGVIRFSV